MDSGLRKRPTYNELIGYIEKVIKIKLPNRDATFLRNSPFFTQLDNFVDTDHETKVNNNTSTTQQANQQAAATGQTASVLRSQVKTSNTPATYHYNIGSPLPSDPNVSFQTGGSSSSQGQGAGSFIPPSSTPQHHRCRRGRRLRRVRGARVAERAQQVVGVDAGVPQVDQVEALDCPQEARELAMRQHARVVQMVQESF